MKSVSASSAARDVVTIATYAVATLVVAALMVTPAAAQSAQGVRLGYASNLHAPIGARLPFAGTSQAVCGQPGVGVGQCLIRLLKPSGATPDASSPTGLSPSTIRRVYGFTASSSAGAGQTIALVDAYNDPTAASDLNEFSAQYGLPSECANGATPPSCFEFNQVNQTGGSSLPAADPGWALEMSLDIEWAHALAPGANILLVEAASNDTSDLLVAEKYAAYNANYVSNSWGAQEFAGETYEDSVYFTQPGVSYFASAGDAGGSVEWPSSSPDVVSVGGTSLTFTSGGNLAQESAWSDGGGGCSSYETANTSQLTGSVNCAGMRATPDLALDADPNSGVSVFDSYGQPGWLTVGGTSAASPMVAAEAAVAGTQVNAEYLYASPPNIPFRDVIAGSNGHPALSGFDLATGLGAWSYTPGVPTALIATSVSGGVTLNWNAPSGAPTNDYTVWRGTASGKETTDIATIGAPTTTYTDSFAPAGPTYYEVQAMNGSGSGPFSNETSEDTANPYTVTFNPNGGTGTMPAETDNTATALTPNAFTRTGYSFVNWNTAANGTGTSYADSALFPFSVNVTLYAQWTATSYTVTFNPNGGTGTMPAESENIATALTPNAFTRTGYSFVNWNTAATGTGNNTYADGASYSFSANVTLYAQWTANPSGPPSTPPSGPPSTPPSSSTVTEISPIFGPTSGGTTVTITGTGFSSTAGDTTVDFGSIAASAVLCASTTSCTATSPGEAASTVDVTVSSPSGTSAPSSADRFTYVPVPTITKVTPTVGPTRGGTKVTIWGSNFVGTVSVHFGEKQATGARVLSSSEITVTSPSGSGIVYLTVSAAGGSSKTTAADRYTFVPAPTITKVTPVVGAARGGTKVTIWGSGFVGAVSVRFGGKLATGVRVLSASEIIAAVPPGSGIVYVTVSAAGGSSKTTVTGRYRY